MNFTKDMSLKKQANPEADKAEQKYLAKDNFQMEKRRFQKVI
tara:strand:+ start:997 stop:1122 length:126 start_codon:yes stop_codon:yes gene_type:complete